MPGEDLAAGLDGRVALVTGASGGLGAHFAAVLARAGARVAVAARRVEGCAAVCDAVRAAGGEAEPFALDVADGASVRAAVAAVAGADLDLVGIGIHGPRNAVDKVLKGAWMHP